jgi:5-methyltetrahydropteroyltriglutamate--homocysteine methyltransferase
MTLAGNLGFPRIGRRRELKAALEKYWSGEIGGGELQATAAALRTRHWKLQAHLGIGHVPSGEFALYDHVLDTACMLGAIPPGYGWSEGPVSLASYFALARGTRAADPAAAMQGGLPALEMTKWFDTNYHYLVPLLAVGQRFTLTENRPLAQYREAMEQHMRTRPVLLGPVSFLLLSKTTDGSDPLDLLDALLAVYARILGELAEAGAAWVQIDEPVLALDLTDKAKQALARAYATLAGTPAPEILLVSYFGPLGDNLATAASLPVAGLHLDLVRGAAELHAVLAALPAERWLSLGIVDGRNVWRTDLRAALATLRRVAQVRGTRRLMVAPSCSLLHAPVDLTQEAELDPEVKSWLAFATQKLQEIVALARGLDEGDAAIAADLAASDAAVRSRQASARVHRAEVADRLAGVTASMQHRTSPYSRRRQAQQAKLHLPLFPTTTIGSFPQTTEVRQARAALTRKDMTVADYETTIRAWIDDAVRWQEELGLDVLVHGEFERNDMVKYFGEQLNGFGFTRHGWVQSYGSRCVAPPIIWGDVSRPAPMTVRWSAYAQSRTARPMKGMLTGPVTMLQWSFVRDDIPRPETCRQIALAIRDEVADLEAAGIAVIQVDEPAFREGLPLRHADWAAYLDWAVACFRLATGCVRDDTSIHTHMCYSEFNDIMPSIADMDADAISIETTRSRMALLDAFVPGTGGGSAGYPAEIGPGVWDIHSPRVPDTQEMVELLGLARKRLEDWQIWVNPDCGLKTRKWEEVRPALKSLVEAALRLRQAAGTPAASDHLGRVFEPPMDCDQDSLGG